MHTCQPVQIIQRGQDLDIRAVKRGVEVADGGYLWRGQLRLWDNEILMGWYAAAEEAVRSKGTLYLVLHQHGQRMEAAGWGSATTDRFKPAVQPSRAARTKQSPFCRTR